jgi:hypothetical protein
MEATQVKLYELVDWTNAPYERRWLTPAQVKIANDGLMRLYGGRAAWVEMAR